jgi:hypothetical protein
VITTCAARFAIEFGALVQEIHEELRASGEVNLGVVSDSPRNSQNGHQVFSESFEE